MAIYAVVVQAACGATYGVVPFVSQRGLGIVCGMVGAGGNAGSAIVGCPALTKLLSFKSIDEHVGTAIPSHKKGLP